MRVFVTGGSGFVGSHVIEVLSAEHEVLAMARSERSEAQVRRWGAIAARCDLGSITVEDLAGVDVVVHAAARAEEHGTREQFWQANVEGTQTMLDAARSAGVKRFVHISTEAVVFAGHDLVDVDETLPYPDHTPFLYAETKAEAERRVLAAAADDFVTIALRPRLVWGPRDTTVLAAVRRMAKDGSWVWVDGGRARTSHTHVRNLAHAVSLAMAHGRGGQAYYVLDDEVHTFRELVEGMATAEQLTLPSRSVPSFVVKPLGRALDFTWQLLGLTGPPPISGLAAAMLSSNVVLVDRKAREELGYAPVVSFAEGLRGLAEASP